LAQWAASDVLIVQKLSAMDAYFGVAFDFSRSMFFSFFFLPPIFSLRCPKNLMFAVLHSRLGLGPELGLGGKVFEFWAKWNSSRFSSASGRHRRFTFFAQHG